MTGILILIETILIQSIQMQLSKTQKTFSDAFLKFLKSRL